MKPYFVLEKKVGETPLSCLENYRQAHPALQNVPLAYAGRLDPMASGKLLVLVGDECKVQEKYHNLDKTYEIEVLFGIGSDSGDVLGLTQTHQKSLIDAQDVRNILCDLVGAIELPYPHFSSKTVHGKPLHTWKVEGRINEIEIPTKRSVLHQLKLVGIEIKTAREIYEYATAKIETIPKVTDERKALGNDFRREDIRASWRQFLETSSNQSFTVARITCTCSSGTYMRTLAEVIAQKLGTKGLAYSIHRSRIGTYKKLFGKLGMWFKVF